MNGVCVTRPGMCVWAWRGRSWVCTNECWTRKEHGHDGLEQYCRDTAPLLCPGPMLHCTCVPTARDWGRLGGSVPCFIAHESHSLGCFFSELAEFQTEICTLNKTCFTEHWIWPQKDTQAACFWVTGLQIQAFPLWKKSFEMACCSFQSVLVMGSRQHAIRDPRPIKAEKEQSSPSLQNIQRNIYSTFATNAAKALKKRGERRT